MCTTTCVWEEQEKRECEKKVIVKTKNQKVYSWVHFYKCNSLVFVFLTMRGDKIDIDSIRNRQHGGEHRERLQENAQQTTCQAETVDGSQSFVTLSSQSC